MTDAASQETLQALLTRLIGMRSQLIDQLASRFDGGVMALIGTVDATACAVEAEIQARRGAEGGE